MVADLKHLLSEESKRREDSKLKSAFKYFADPNIVFLGGGLPLSDYFPWEKVTAESPSAPFANGIGAKITAGDATVSEITKEPSNEIDIPLKTSLQYGWTAGQPQIKKFLEEHTKIIHNPPYEGWESIVSVGNTQSWDATLRTFCDFGDSILVEEFSFPASIEAAKSQGVKTVPIAIDEFGILPDKLDEQLSKWEGKKPKLLYTIPTGQNPTGSCLSEERRRKILDLANKYDFIIIEDEPYYFLQMEEYTEDASKRGQTAVHSHEDFQKSLIKSMLSMDTEGRVIRLDSFSKVIAPGTRFGWITGQSAILERYIRIHEVTIQAPSGFSQSLVSGLLNRWGQSGYLDWLIGLRHEYTVKRDTAIDAIAKYFPKEVTTYIPPVAGMFFTVSFDISKHPKYETEFQKDPLKAETAIYEAGLKNGCLMIPGSWFSVADDHTGKTTVFYRGTYAAVPLDELVSGLQRFGEAVKKEFNL